MSTSLRTSAPPLRIGVRAASGFVRHAADVAEYFGFRPVREIGVRERSYTFAKAAATAIAAARPQEPSLAHYLSATPAHAGEWGDIKHQDIGEFGLVIAGADESLAEAILARTLVTIVSEWGLPVVRVRLNTMGDRDSKVRFGRELSGYLRKHHDLLDEECRQKISSDPAGVYLCRSSSCRDVFAGGPRPMNFLSEKSRLHFRELLEHIEHLALPYELDDFLVGDERESRVTFAIDTDTEGLVIATQGGRYDEHARRLGATKPVALCAGSIYFRKSGLSAASFAALHKPRRPRVYFVQLGARAKLQGLAVVDTLRRAGIPVMQSFSAQSLAPQLAAAKAAGIDRLIIMGAREALDNTVLIRAIDNSSQEVVSLRDLHRHLRSLR